MAPAGSGSFSHSVQWRAVPLLWGGGGGDTVQFSGVTDHYITVVFCDVLASDYSVSVTVSALLASSSLNTVVCCGVLA